jgi:very-short-patch-repair endonuclease
MNICNQNKFTLTSVEQGQVFFKCDGGHDGVHSLSNFYKGTNCTVCSSQERRSKGEKEVEEFLLSLQLHVESSNRSLIHPYELDLYIPDHKIAIEYDGKFYHSEGYKDKKYHLMKTEMCEEQGIQLIHIFDDEWELQRDKVKNRLKSICGMGTRYHARKCTVKPIGHAQAKQFCDQHHTQNYGQSLIKLGLFHDDVLISVMTFSKLNISKGGKNKIGSWELNRFCSMGNVVGGAGKLLAYFKKNYP